MLKTVGPKTVPVYTVGAVVATVGLDAACPTVGTCVAGATGKLVGDTMADGALDGDEVGTLVGATVVKVATWSAEICPVTSP